MDARRIKARRSLDQVRFTGRIGDLQVIDTRDNFSTTGSSHLTKSLATDELFARLESQGPTASPDCVLVYIGLNDSYALDIDKGLFLNIYNRFRLDPLMLRFLGNWDPASCRPSNSKYGDTTDPVSSYYMRLHGYCLMWTYDKNAGSVRGLILPKSLNYTVHTDFHPDLQFLNSLAEDLRTYGNMVAEEHGFTFIACASIVEHISHLLGEAYAAIVIVEQSTGHSAWTVQHAVNLDDLNQGSKDIGKATHLLIVVKRHVDCMKTAYHMVLSDFEKSRRDSAVLAPLLVLKNDLEALGLETGSLMQRAKSQMSVVCTRLRSLYYFSTC
jgi:hypothetical protein